MRNARRMVLIDPQTIEPVPKHASVRAMTRLDREMMQVLERDDWSKSKE